MRGKNSRPILRLYFQPNFSRMRLFFEIKIFKTHIDTLKKNGEILDTEKSRDKMSHSGCCHCIDCCHHILFCQSSANMLCSYNLSRSDQQASKLLQYSEALKARETAICHALARFCSQSPKISLKTLFVSHIWPITAENAAPYSKPTN